MGKSVNSRTRNTILNFATSIGGEGLNIVLQFVCRTVFIETLGKSYLGISGLFSNVLSLLSLAEFGVGNAILFKLYDPLVKGDQHRVTVLMKFYRQVYTIIGIAVAAIGVLLVPFLPTLIGDYETISGLGLNPVWIFLLYLLNSVSSYLFFAYKSAIVKADQKEYILNLSSYVITVAKNVLQIIVLVLFHDFVLYVVVMIASVIIQNFVHAIIAEKHYPYINNKTTEKISLSEVKEIIKDCSALFLYRINGVILKSTDNIALSVFMGLDVVALYSNYYVFYTTINTVFIRVYGAVAHSIGNLHANSDQEHEYQVFKTMELVTAILGGTACVGIFAVADEFIHVWIGADWVIAFPFSFLMGIELFTLAFRSMLTKYRNAMGQFQQAKFRPVLGAIIKVSVSIVLVNIWGIPGVILGTVIADWTTFMVFDPQIIHKFGFKNAGSIKKFYGRTVKYLGIAITLGFLTRYLCRIILPGCGWLSLVVHIALVLIIVPGIYIVLSIKTSEGRFLLRKVTGKLKIGKRVSK